MRNFAFSNQLAFWQYLDTNKQLPFYTTFNQNTYVAQTQSTILGDSPLFYFPLNETSGTTATDVTGNGYSGTYNGGYTLTGSGVTFDGSSGYVNITKTLPTLSALTIEATFTITGYNAAFGGSTGVTIIESSENGSGGLDLAINNSSGVWWWPQANADLLEGSVVSSNASHHIILTQNSAGLATVYIDFIQVAQGTRLLPIAGSTNLKIGHKSWVGGWMQGTLSNVAMYNYAFTSSQVLNHFTAPITPEMIALSNGCTEYYKEVSSNLTEIIFTSPSSSVLSVVPDSGIL